MMTARIQNGRFAKKGNFARNCQSAKPKKRSNTYATSAHHDNALTHALVAAVQADVDAVRNLRDAAHELGEAEPVDLCATKHRHHNDDDDDDDDNNKTTTTTTTTTAAAAAAEAAEAAAATTTSTDSEHAKGRNNNQPRRQQHQPECHKMQQHQEQ